MADNPITREEIFMSAAAGDDIEIPEPITREEMLLAKAAGMDIDLTEFAIVTRKEMYLKKIADNSGGSSVEVEALTATENKTYTAPEGKAYSPVTVNVPNSYGASDEGKVVSSGALVAQTAHAKVTQNGTIDTTLNNSVEVDVSGGGASNVVYGSFTASDAGVLDVDLNYSGSGYPVALYIWVADGAYNTNGDGYKDGTSYVPFLLVLNKMLPNVAPEYNVNGTLADADKGMIGVIYRSSGNNIARSDFSNLVKWMQSGNVSDYSWLTVLLVRSATRFSVLAKNETGTNYAFPVGITYNYCVVYSE